MSKKKKTFFFVFSLILFCLSFCRFFSFRASLSLSESNRNEKNARPGRAHLLRVPAPSSRGRARRRLRRPRRARHDSRRQRKNRASAPRRRRQQLFFLFFFYLFHFSSSYTENHGEDAHAPLRAQRRRYRRGLLGRSDVRRGDRAPRGALGALVAAPVPEVAPRGKADAPAAASSRGGRAQGRGAGGGEGP